MVFGGGEVGKANGETHRDHVAYCSHKTSETARYSGKVISMVLRE